MSTTDSTAMEQNPITDLTTGFLRDMLVVISKFDEPPSGQQVMDRMEDIAGYDELTHGRIYPNLDKLVRAGYVDKGEIDRRTNYYKISTKGKHALNRYAEFVEYDD